MGLLSGLADSLTGGLAHEVIGAVEKYFPPDMTPEQKANVQLAMENLELQRKAQADSAMNEAEKTLNERIAMFEGSASDLKAVPYLGAFMLLLRGAQRPVWGFATLYLDYGVFSGLWSLKDPVIQNAFWIVNFLVLGFLFGERAVTNIMPFITNMVQAKAVASRGDQ
jgi:hypothetical protein